MRTSEIERLNNHVNALEAKLQHLKAVLRLIADDPRTRTAIRDMAMLALRK